MNLNRISSAIIAAVCLMPVGAHAAEKAGVKMPDTVSVGGKTLQLNGLGVREATIFAIDVYVAGLYVPEKSNNAQKLMTADVPKKLVLTFVRDVDADDVTKAFVESFKKNKFSEKIQSKLKTLNGWMSDMKDEQSMSFTYVPGEGMTVEVRGEKKGTIEGADFQQSFLAIWLGSSPPNSGLKKGLLGK
ncbi:MAG: chalcone isomerase family protein [Myxococcota bacterium]